MFLPVPLSPSYLMSFNVKLSAVGADKLCAPITMPSKMRSKLTVSPEVNRSGTVKFFIDRSCPTVNKKGYVLTGCTFLERENITDMLNVCIAKSSLQ